MWDTCIKPVNPPHPVRVRVLQSNSITRMCVCVCVCIEEEIYFKELAHAVVWGWQV